MDENLSPHSLLMLFLSPLSQPSFLTLLPKNLSHSWYFAAAWEQVLLLRLIASLSRPLSVHAQLTLLCPWLWLPFSQKQSSASLCSQAFTKLALCFLTSTQVELEGQRERTHLSKNETLGNSNYIVWLQHFTLALHMSKKFLFPLSSLGI